MLTLDSKKMLVDAAILTDDPSFSPKKFEAAKAPNQQVVESMFLKIAAESEYPESGVSDKIVSPLIFRFLTENNRPVVVRDGNPVIFHLLLPNGIDLKNFSGHWAGQTWASQSRPVKVPLKVKKLGSVKGMTHWTVDFHYASIEFNAFIKAQAGKFNNGQLLNAKYYIEYKQEKQPLQIQKLVFVALKPTPQFKNIYIGPCGGNARSFFMEYPGFGKNLAFGGMNFINAWNAYPEMYKYTDRWNKFVSKCLDAKIAVTYEISPGHGLYGPSAKDDFAVDINGKISHKPSLTVSAKSRGISNVIKKTEQCTATAATGVVFDDEQYNSAGDKYDYSPRTKAAFKKYLESKGFKYVDPVKIVKAPKSYPKLYEQLRDFRCARNASYYALYQQAYEKGLAKAKRSTTFGKKMLVAQVCYSGNWTKARNNNYWDCRMLAPYCTWISPMIYTYAGIRYSDEVGDTLEEMNKAVGRVVGAPTLLCEHRMFGLVTRAQKPMFTYQILESLMQKSPMITFWYGPSVMNPLNMQHISNAIRQAVPYEKFFIDGSPVKLQASPSWVRVKALKLKGQTLIYVANYRNASNLKARITVPGVVRVLDVASGKNVKIDNASFTTNFKSSRGKLFVATH